MTDDLLLTTAEVAAIMCCSTATIRRRVADGTLPALRLTPKGPFRYDKSSLPLEGNMAISKRKGRGGWPMVDFRYTDDNGVSRRVQVKCPSRDPRANRKFEQEVRAAVAAGTWKTEKKTTVKQFVPFLIAYLQADDAKPSYIKTVERILEKHIVKALGNKTLGGIKNIDIADYKTKKRKQGLSNKTINNHLGVLSKLLAVAFEDNLVPQKLTMKLLKVGTRKPQYLTRKEADRLVAACEGKMFVRVHAMIVTALGTGMRLGELLGLQWQDIDFKNKTITIERNWCTDSMEYVWPKNWKSRVVPLTPKVEKVLRAYPRKLVVGESQVVFASLTHGGSRHRKKHKGTPGRKAPLGESLRKACDRAKLPRFGWHRLRHTYASWLVQGGASIYEVQELLGHHSLEQTKQYAHLAPENFVAAVAVLRW